VEASFIASGAAKEAFTMRPDSPVEVVTPSMSGEMADAPESLSRGKRFPDYPALPDSPGRAR
jgi:hypothetical protein